MPVLYTNNAKGTLASGIIAGATSFTLNSGQGALFPSPAVNEYFYVTLQEGSAQEVVKCTERSGDTFTCLATTNGFSAGARVELRVCKELLDELQASLAAHASDGGAHGAVSAATANAIIRRDANGRAKVAAPAASDDIARKAEVDTVQTNLTNHQNATGGVHGFAPVVGTAQLYAARAWVNFNGTGVVAIRASGNVSSITDNGVGDYTVNLSTAMPDANYAVHATASGVTDGDLTTLRGVHLYGPNAQTTSSVRLLFINGVNMTLYDVPIASVTIMR